MLAPEDSDPDWEDDWVQGVVFGVSDGPSLVIATGTGGGPVSVSIQVLTAAPNGLEESLIGWEVGEEEDLFIGGPMTLYCPQYVGDLHPDALTPSRPGLHRVRVLARGRVTENDGSSTEEFQLTCWPVTSPEPRRRCGGDDL
jgi:hypothetical protein